MCVCKRRHYTHLHRQINERSERKKKKKKKENERNHKKKAIKIADGEVYKEEQRHEYLISMAYCLYDDCR